MSICSTGRSSLTQYEELASELLREAWSLKDDKGHILRAWQLVAVMISSYRTMGAKSGFRGATAELFGETLCLGARLNLDQHKTGEARKLLVEADELPYAPATQDRFGRMIQGIRAHSYTAEYAFDRAVEEYRNISTTRTDPLLVRNIGMAHRGAGLLDEARAKLEESLRGWQSQKKENRLEELRTTDRLARIDIEEASGKKRRWPGATP